jgi:hypothetical protein
MISCALIIPYALIFGGLRGIPLGWRFVDCSFGVFGFVPVLLCKKWAEELGRRKDEKLVAACNEPLEKQEAARF